MPGITVAGNSDECNVANVLTEHRRRAEVESGWSVADAIGLPEEVRDRACVPR